MSDREQQLAERRKQQEADAKARADAAARRRELWDSLLPWQRHVASNYEERVGVDRKVIADQVLYGHRYAGRDSSPGESSSSRPSSSSSPSGHGSMSMGGVEEYEKAKKEWEKFKVGFAERVKSVSDEMVAQGEKSWGEARAYVNSGLRTPEREAAYFDAYPGAREWSEGTSAQPGTGRSALSHWLNQGRGKGNTYIDPEQPRGYGL